MRNQALQNGFSKELSEINASEGGRWLKCAKSGQWGKGKVCLESRKHPLHKPVFGPDDMAPPNYRPQHKISGRMKYPGWSICAYSL